jgi:signal transduction histidine kinase
MKVGFFSIRFKFLIVMSLLLAACVCVYLLIAVKVFKADKTELVFDLNRSQVSNMASELDTQFEGISDKFKLFAMLSSSGGNRYVGDLFTKDSDVVFVAMYRGSQDAHSSGAEVVKKFENKTYRETYGLSEHFYEKDVPAQREIPFAGIYKNGEAIWNATLKDGPALMGFGRRVVVEDSRGAAVDQMAVVGYIRLDRVLKSVAIVKLSEITVANRDGEIIAAASPEVLRGSSLVSHEPLFQAALQSKAKTSVMNLEGQGRKILGAFSKAHNDEIVVLAQADEKLAFGAVTSLVERSLIFALIVITTAFLAAVLLSRSLTQPLAELVDRMDLASQGDLSTPLHLDNHDETAILAESFNKMIGDLKTSRDQLEEINRDLDLKVKERTRQLEEQNHVVKEAQEALLRTTRLASAGEIAGKAAHEVLNPLTSLLTRVGIMERKIRNEMVPQLGLLKEIKTSWDKDYQAGGFEKMLEIWNGPSSVNQGQTLWQEDLANIDGVATSLNEQLTALSHDSEFLAKEGARINKIINGMRKLSVVRSDKKKHSAHELLKDCSHIMADLFSQRDYQIEQKFEAAGDLVFLDRDEFVQAVTNMMRNSLQAMDEARTSHQLAHGTLTLRTVMENKMLKIFIEDNGVGISGENQEKLFKGQFTTKSPDEGTGLGLGISRRFIRAYGGDIEFVSSVPFEKTIFCIQLPIHDASAKEVAA